MNMTKNDTVEVWDTVVLPYYPPDPALTQPAQLQRRPSMSQAQIMPKLAAATRQTQGSGFGVNTMRVVTDKSIRVGIWNIQNFGGGISCMWNDMPRPAAHEAWCERYPTLWTIPLPDVSNAKKRKKQLYDNLTSAGYTEGLSENVVEYHDLALRAYGLADHISTLDCDVIILLEVMQRWSGGSNSAAARGDQETRAMYFMFGVWYAIQNGEIPIKVPDVYGTEDTFVFNFLGFKRPDPEKEREIDFDVIDPHVKAFQRGRTAFIEAHSVACGSADEESVSLLLRFAAHRLRQCSFLAQNNWTTISGGVSFGFNDDAISEYAFNYDDALFFGALLAYHDDSLPRDAIDKTKRGKKGTYLSNPHSSSFNSLAATTDSWDSPIFAKTGEGNGLYAALQSIKQRWKWLVERRGWASTAEYLIAPVEEEPDENKSPAFTNVLGMLNARLTKIGHAQFTAIKKPNSLKSAETIAFAVRDGGDFNISDIEIWHNEGGATFERPVHVFRVNGNAPSSLSCVLLAAHAPAPNHWDKHPAITRNWFADMNGIANQIQAEDPAMPVILMGDLNVKGDNPEGPTCFQNWIPDWDTHKNIQTSYTMKGIGDQDKWSEAYDKILVHAYANGVNNTMYKDQRWNDASLARKYSDHSFVVSDLTVTPTAMVQFDPQELDLGPPGVDDDDAGSSNDPPKGANKRDTFDHGDDEAPPEKEDYNERGGKRRHGLPKRTDDRMKN